jgi:hypothetical protein
MGRVRMTHQQLCHSPQSPPNFRGNWLFASLSLVVATRGNYKPFGY